MDTGSQMMSKHAKPEDIVGKQIQNRKKCRRRFLNTEKTSKGPFAYAQIDKHK
jgi:hypothetical protein